MNRNPKILFKEVGRWVILVFGIALSIFPSFLNINEIIKNSDLIRPIGISLFIAAVLWFLYDLNKKFLWEEPNIVLTSYPKSISTEDSFYNLAVLEFFNKEELPITKCFATLELANDIHINNSDTPLPFNFVPSIKPSQRIRWEEKIEMNENYEMTIMGGASRHLSIGSFKNMFFYHVQEGDIENQRNFGIPIHTVRIRIDGYFNERQMKPLFFDGYIYAANLTPPDDLVARKGKPKSNAEEISNRIKNLRMVFKSGEWMSDNEIKKYMGVKEYNLAQH